MQTYPVSSPLADVSIRTPDERAPRRGRYDELIATIKGAAGEWVAITDPDLIHGQTPKAKAATIHSAAIARGIKIRTTVQHSLLYVRQIAGDYSEI